MFSSEPTDQQSSRQRSSLFRLVSMAAEQLVPKKTSRSYIYLYIQMELCREENLAKWLKTRKPVELNVHQMYREILSAVKYLHSLELVHRDLKPSNIFFNFDWSIKVGDFGLSKRITAGESSPTTSSEGRQWDGFDRLNQTLYIGTKPYMAPEQESSNTYNHKVDVYALAIILFELLMGPFKTDSERIDLISRLKSFQLPPKLQDANIKQLLLKMLSVDPNKRPEVKDILSEHFPKEVKQLNPRPVKRQNSRPLVHTPIRHASDVFQSKLLMLFLIRGIRKGYQFELGTQMSELGGIFDDLIFKYQVDTSKDNKPKWRYRFVQAKYKQDETFKITGIQLLNGNLGDFCLAKYFRSFMEIKRTGEDIKDCIICTNVGLDVNSLIKDGLGLAPVNPPEDILTFENFSRGKKPACYKLKITEHLRQKVTVSDYWSDIYLLADKLREHGKFNKVIPLNQDVFKRYHVALVNERVVDLNTKKFHEDFLDSVNLSAGATQLRQIICNFKGGEADLKNWKFKLSSKFGGITTAATRVDLLPQRVTYQDIDEFFDKLLFAVDTPNVVKLDQILIKEVGQHFKLLGLHMLQSVWNLTYKKFLSSEDGMKILEDTEQTMVSINLTTLSVDYQEHLRKAYCQHELKDNQMINELKQFLCRTKKNNLRFLGVSSTSPGSTAVKVFSVLETLRDFKQQDSYLVVSSNRMNDVNQMEQWKKTLELKPSKLLIIVCESGDSFVYRQILQGTAVKKKVIIISRSHQVTPPSTDIWKEIQDRPWQKLECIQINFKKINHEGLRDTLRGLLSEPHNRNTAVVFIQGIIQDDVSSLKKLAPENYELVYNRTENNQENTKGFAAIVVNRSLDFERILPSGMLYDPKMIAGIELSFNESSLFLYSVYHCADAANKELGLESNASKKVVCSSPPVAVNPVANHPEKEIECKRIYWPEGDEIRHGTDVHISNWERLQSPDGKQSYIRFSI
ncbi:uncharacterized protein LOC124204427 isoform X3 [Daphnia pulex]|nr:uncharacterized protein LOC124204427 isoform X3 [Daphnia pulex]